MREAVCGCLRDLSASGPAVIEGRDIGTAVFPDADLKIFLTASIEERARRRASEMRGKGLTVTEEEVARSIAERDRRDSEREVAPLRRAADAVVIDTTQTDVEGQVRLILRAWGDLRDREDSSELRGPPMDHQRGGATSLGTPRRRNRERSPLGRRHSRFEPQVVPRSAV